MYVIRKVNMEKDILGKDNERLREDIKVREDKL
jgi:hypothetical protein